MGGGKQKATPILDSGFVYGKIVPPGGMAERLKAHVLKTCLGHTNVGSNPTPSAHHHPVVTTSVSMTKATTPAIVKSTVPGKSLLGKIWGGARVVEWGRLLSGYRGEILGRRFESCPPRHIRNAFPPKAWSAFLFGRTPPLRGWYSNPALASPLPKTRSRQRRGARFC